MEMSMQMMPSSRGLKRARRGSEGCLIGGRSYCRERGAREPEFWPVPEAAGGLSRPRFLASFNLSHAARPLDGTISSACTKQFSSGSGVGLS